MIPLRPGPCYLGLGDGQGCRGTVLRKNLHPADQFEAFKRPAEEQDFGAEEVAARFGVTPQVVR